MIFKKNRHYCTPFPWPSFYRVKDGKSLKTEMWVTFDDSIRYDIGEDQSDVNKLFGFSYGWHHKDSDRIGFRYVPELDNVEIVLYSYRNGKRSQTVHIDNVEIGERIQLGLYINIYNATPFNMGREITAFVSHDGINAKYVHKLWAINECKFGYTLGGYFGGNRRAPHKITITT